MNLTVDYVSLVKRYLTDNNVKTKDDVLYHLSYMLEDETFLHISVLYQAMIKEFGLE